MEIKKNQNKAKNQQEGNRSQGEPFFLKSGVSPMWKITPKERVKFLLASKGMTQNQLADMIGINHGTLSKIINGNWIPTAKIKLLMAKYLEVDSLVLFGDLKYFENYAETIKVNPEKENENN